MLLFLALCAFFGFLFNFAFTQLLPISAELHNICLLKSPSSSYQPFYEAIVCGKSLPLSLQYNGLKNLGLIHIIVVSGSHLVFVTQIMKSTRIKLPKTLIYLLLFLFTLMTRMDPPITRAFIHYVLQDFLILRKLNYTSSMTLLSSVIFCVAMNPAWFYSQSLLLSAGASIGISRGKNTFSQSLLCYLGLLPLLLEFTTLSPLSILMNSVFTPLISFFLFPASLLCFIFPLQILTDCLWELLFALIAKMQMINTIQLNWNWPAPDLNSKWLYILSLSLLNHHLERKGL